jgi:hypothetical protein
VLGSLQDHFRTGMCDLDHPILADAKKPIVGMIGRGICNVVFL